MNVTTETAIRRRLTAFFMTLPPPESRTREQWTRYRCALAQLRDLENRAILHTAAAAILPRCGDVGALITDTLMACGVLTGASGVPLRLFAEGAAFPHHAADPRRLEIAVAELVRAVSAGERVGIRAIVRREGNALCLRLRGDTDRPIGVIPACVAVIARQHGGRVLTAGGQVCLTLTQPEGEPIGTFPPIHWVQRLQNPLSVPWSRLYTADF